MSELANELLMVLTDKPTPASYIVDYLGLRNKADLRALVHELRCNGYPICSKVSDHGGYWYGNDQDVARTLADLKSRRRELSEIIDAMERGPLDGQMEAEL